MNQQWFDARRAKALAAASYAIAAMFVFIPLMELGTSLGWTVQPSALNWRTGAVGMLSGATLTPIFGVFLAVLTAAVLGHRWVQRGLGAIAALGGITLLVVLMIFALDAFQLRPNVAPAMKRTFDLAMLKALISLTVGSLTLLALAYSAFAAARKNPDEVTASRRSATVASAGTPLVRTNPGR